jgi:chromosomal replication initiator protein
MQPEQVWQAALGQLQLEMPTTAFETWVRGTSLLQDDAGYVVGVSNAYARDWLDNRLRGAVRRTLSGILGRTVEVRFEVNPANGNGKAHADPERGAAAPMLTPAELALTRPGPARPISGGSGGDGAGPAVPGTSTLNPKYVFDTFVVGPSNRMAHAACHAAAENPARAYNPLFIYGGVGLGKTHLLQAVGNKCRGRGLSVLYVSSEEFTNDLIEAIRNHSTETFRDKYRTIDVLLVDDVQFIAGKESTQEEFFHTFNALHGQDKQLVLTSDRPPKAMVTLEERLRSRFEWGLSVDIQPPDLETRMAILRSKAERGGRTVEPAVLELIARRMQSNIRELEGALTRVLAYAELINQPLTLSLANSALADLLPRARTLTADQIIEEVARFYNLTVEDLIGPDRSKEVAMARQVAMYLVREDTDASLPDVGKMLGGRDHTTIIYGCKKIADIIERDDALRRQVIAIRERLYSAQG